MKEVKFESVLTKCRKFYKDQTKPHFLKCFIDIAFERFNITELSQRQELRDECRTMFNEYYSEKQKDNYDLYRLVFAKIRR